MSATPGPYTRRSFLKGLGAAAVGVATFLYPGTAESESTKQDLRIRMTQKRGSQVLRRPNVRRIIGPDPTFAEGDVTQITAGGLLLENPEFVYAVRLPQDTAVWKEYWLTPAAIALGDWVDVKGTPQGDGSLLATSGMVFVNIGKRSGNVAAIEADALTLTGPRGTTHNIAFSPILEVIDKDTGATRGEGMASLAVGAPAGAVGLLLPDKTLRATRIWY